MTPSTYLCTYLFHGPSLQIKIEYYAHLLLPRLLRAEVVVGLEAEDLDGGDVEVHEDVLEGGPVARLGRPALLDEQLEAVGAGGGDGQLQRVAAHAPDDGRAVDVLVGHLAAQQLPQAHPERPDVHLLVARLVTDHLVAGEGGSRRLLRIIFRYVVGFVSWPFY